MSDTATAPVAAGSIDMSSLEAIAKEIATLNEQIAAVSGSENAVKNSILTKMVADNSPAIDNLFQSIVPQFRALGETNIVVLAGFLHRFESVMGEEFGPAIEELVDGKVKELTSDVKENVAPLKESRKAKLEAFRAFKLVLETLGYDTSSVPEPKLTGGRGSGSGSSAAKTPSKVGWNEEQARYVINDKVQPPSQNSLTSLNWYATLGCAGTETAPARWAIAEFKEFLSNAGVDVNTNSWGPVELPNGKKVSARPLDPEQDKDIYDKVAELEAAKSTTNDDSEGETEDEAPAEAPVNA